MIYNKLKEQRVGTSLGIAGAIDGRQESLTSVKGEDVSLQSAFINRLGDKELNA